MQRTMSQWKTNATCEDHIKQHETEKLSAKAIQSPALPLQCINHIHGSYSLPLGMLSVGDSITDDIFQENLQYTKALTYYIHINTFTLRTPLVSS